MGVGLGVVRWRVSGCLLWMCDVWVSEVLVGIL